MTERLGDPEIPLLATIAATLKQDYIQEGAVDPWADSLFAWIRGLKSRRVGKVGEQLMSGWFAAKGFDVMRCPDADANRIIGGHRMEIKFSTLWESGIYNFQQLRDQNYEYAVCLGLSPFAAGCWISPKRDLIERLRTQHGGTRASDTRWLQFPATAPPARLAPHGGTLGQAFKVLESIAK